RQDTLDVLERCRSGDPRIKIVRAPENLHIAGASNLAARQATGEFLAFLDHDDVLHPHALREVALALQQFPETDLLYTDEDKINSDGNRHQDPFYKPDWSPEYLESVMYMLHMLTVRSALFRELGGFRTQVSGAQDYDLALRASRLARRVHHIPKILYHWRMIPGSAAAAIDAKPQAIRAARLALQDALSASGQPGHVEDGLLPATFRARWDIVGNPPVTLLILTNHVARSIPGRGRIHLLQHFIRSILDKSTYPNYRILVVDNGNAQRPIKRYLDRNGVRVVSYSYAGPFNYSRKFNFSTRYVETNHVICLNDDLEVITPEWIESLLEFSQKPEIGVAGARLLHAQGTVQHAGVVLGVNGSAAHLFHGLPGDQVGYYGYSHVIRNFSAVTGAVMATRMEIIQAVNGFDERMAIDLNDIDFCLRVQGLGKRIVYTPYAQLYHFEGASQERKAITEADVKVFRRRWQEVMDRDPFYNPNLPKDRLNNLV
ncbi:MAG TPA: glycosyltransferase, partial [bacterium]|nr:glycosyltransferase [bacterium]